MLSKNAIALGTFDGVHIGHRMVLNLPDDYKKTAVTFALPPKSVLSGNKGLITTIDDKCRILKDLGFEDIELLEFEKIRNMSAIEFLNFLKQKYNPDYISCGFNYKFGKNGAGTTETLKNYCLENSITLNVSDCVEKDGIPVSSTVIRNMLSNGDIVGANKLLSMPFSFEGEVVSGDKRGRTLGFPTINQKYPEELVKVKFGVYKTRVEFDGKHYIGITNIGIRPTYKTDYVTSETYISGFSGNLYGKNVRITLLEFLREERKFSNSTELKNQIEADLKNIKEI